MELHDVEQEISNIIKQLKIELAELSRGTDMMKSAQQASGRVVNVSEELAEAFKHIRQRFEQLEQRINAVDFAKYFENVEQTLNETNNTVKEVSKSTASSTKNLNATGEKIEDMRKNVEHEVVNITSQVKQLSASLEQMDKSIKDASNRVGQIELQWESTCIDDRLDQMKNTQLQTTTALIENVDGTFKNIQKEVITLARLVSATARDFEQVNFQQKFKDVEYSMVKVTGELEAVSRRQDGLAEQQTQMLQILNQQQQNVKQGFTDIYKKIEESEEKIQSKLQQVLMVAGASVVVGLVVGFYLVKH